MANVNKPFGLRPLGNLSATGAQKQYGYLIADNQSGAIYQGDLVTIDNGYLVKFNNTDHTSKRVMRCQSHAARMFIFVCTFRSACAM